MRIEALGLPSGKIAAEPYRYAAMLSHAEAVINTNSRKRMLGVGGEVR